MANWIVIKFIFTQIFLLNITFLFVSITHPFSQFPSWSVSCWFLDTIWKGLLLKIVQIQCKVKLCFLEKILDFINLLRVVLENSVNSKAPEILAEFNFLIFHWGETCNICDLVNALKNEVSGWDSNLRVRRVRRLLGENW